MLGKTVEPTGILPAKTRRNPIVRQPIHDKDLLNFFYKYILSGLSCSTYIR